MTNSLAVSKLVEQNRFGQGKEKVVTDQKSGKLDIPNQLIDEKLISMQENKSKKLKTKNNESIHEN